MPLTDAALRAAKPQAAAYKLHDERGLYLLVQPNGRRYWRCDFRLHGKRRTLAIGVYDPRRGDAVSLAEARARRDEARRMVAEGLDPTEEKRRRKREQLTAVENNFKAVAEEWLALQKARWTASTFSKAEWMLGSFVYPAIGDRPIGDVTPPDLLQLLRTIEARGTNETAHRTKQRCSQIFRYAIAAGKPGITSDPTRDLQGALAPVVTKHRSAITDPAGVGALMRAIREYSGQPSTAAALKLAPLVLLRPGELRAGEWREIDFSSATWRVPAHRMKMREEHIVPLSTQAVDILRDLHRFTGHWQFLFPSLRSPRRCMSENTVTAALRRLGYSGEEMTGHGFRALASTLLYELGWPSDAIERQLAHARRNRVRAAYDRAQHLERRREMLQAWADYLDAIADDRRGRELGAPSTPNSALHR